MTLALTGHHALVTGGGRGIGAAIARRLLEEGASVTLLGRDCTALDAAMQALEPLAVDGAALGVATADIADPDAVTGAFALATDERGPITLLINNAGQAHSAPFTKTDLALWRRMLDVNLTGTFLCTQAALPAMLEQGWGRIVNVASTAGLIGYGYVSAYCAAKHGVIGLTRALALELATKGITVNAVCPGYTETELLRESLDQIMAKTSRSEQDARDALARHNPQRRFVQPEEVANAVLWLCAPGSGSMNGQSISVSGGEVT